MTKYIGQKVKKRVVIGNANEAERKLWLIDFVKGLIIPGSRYSETRGALEDVQDQVEECRDRIANLAKLNALLLQALRLNRTISKSELRRILDSHECGEITEEPCDLENEDIPF